MVSNAKHEAKWEGTKKLREHRNFLIASIQALLVSEITKLGFKPTPRTPHRPVDRELVVSFPFPPFVRIRSDGLDLIEIQLATYRRPKFRINAGIVPKEGMDTVTGHFPAEEVCVHWLNEYFELYSSPQWRQWFSLWFWRCRRPLQSDYDSLVQRAVSFLPELDLGLQHRQLGPHIRRILIPRRPNPAPFD